MTNKKQIDKFRKAAKELECNESEKDFDVTLKKLVKEKPKQVSD